MAASAKAPLDRAARRRRKMLKEIGVSPGKNVVSDAQHITIPRWLTNFGQARAKWEMSDERFCADSRTMWAVYSQVLVIGEAAKRISREFQDQHPGVPWGKMISLRNRLIHGYDEIDWNRVWETATDDLPELKAAIEPLIPKEP